MALNICFIYLKDQSSNHNIIHQHNGLNNVLTKDFYLNNVKSCLNINLRFALVFIDCLVWGCSTEYEKLWILFAQKSVNVKEISDLIKKVVGMKLSQMHFILNGIPKVWKIFAKWIPHLLTDKHIRAANQLFKMFSKFNQRQFCKHWYWYWKLVNYFKPVSEIENKIPGITYYTRKNACIYCIFFSMM